MDVSFPTFWVDRNLAYGEEKPSSEDAAPADPELLEHMQPPPPPPGGPPIPRLTPHKYVRAMLAATRGSEAPVPELVWPVLATTPCRVTGEGADRVVLEMNLKVQSLCEHHLLPFHGVAHVVSTQLPHRGCLLLFQECRCRHHHFRSHDERRLLPCKSVAPALMR